MRREDFNDKCKRGGFRVLVSHFNPYLHYTLIFALEFQQKITLSVIEIRFIRLEIATETKGDLKHMSNKHHRAMPMQYATFGNFLYSNKFDCDF